MRNTVVQTLPRKVAATIRERRLLSSGQRVLVAVSGGPDSMSLLHYLSGRAAHRRWQLAVAHVNYGVRGVDADVDEALVRKVAADYKLPCFVYRVPKGEFDKGNFEARARSIRYDFFAGLCRQHGFAKVAVAHTADDRAETVVMKVLRGTGLAGLVGMDYCRGFVDRPFLDVRKKDVLTYARGYRLAYRTDATNFDTGYTRNYIRHELLPYLSGRAGVDVVPGILVLAKAAAVEKALVDARAQAMFRAVTLISGRVSQAAFNNLHPDDQLLVTRVLVARYVPEADFSKAQYLRLRSFIRGAKTGKRLQAHKRLTLDGAYGSIGIEQQPFTIGFSLHETPLRVPGRTAFMSNSLVVQKQKPRGRAMSSATTFDLDQLCLPLIVRTWQPGDTVAPMGMRGRHKKLQDVFTDIKLPKQTRHRLPVVVDARGRVLWVPGICRSQHAGVKTRTTNSIHVIYYG